MRLWASKAFTGTKWSNTKALSDHVKSMDKQPVSAIKASGFGPSSILLHPRSTSQSLLFLSRSQRSGIVSLVFARLSDLTWCPTSTSRSLYSRRSLLNAYRHEVLSRCRSLLCYDPVCPSDGSPCRFHEAERRGCHCSQVSSGRIQSVAGSLIKL